MPAATETLLNRITALQTELIDLAYRLDGQGRADAAEVAITTAARLSELRAAADSEGAAPRAGTSDADG